MLRSILGRPMTVPSWHLKTTACRTYGMRGPRPNLQSTIAAATATSYCRSFFSTKSTSPSKNKGQEETSLHQEERTSSSLVTKSGRRHFKDIAVNPAILRYIQTLGVGMKPAQAQRKKLHRLAQWSSLLEDDRHAGRRGRRRRSAVQPIPRGSDTGNNKGDNSNPITTTSTTSSSKRQHLWKPPLPFGPDAKPVKIMGRISHTSQPLPAPSTSPSTMTDDNNRQLISLPPQVALCGRSNVGKSTLLNALLYGNRTFAADYSATDQANKKGQTPRQVMLPKGCKAVTSPRPGETRDITFYQLAASKFAKNQDSDASSSSASASKLLLWLVDLPGFGFAHGNEQVKDTYQQLVSHYLLGLLKSNPRGSTSSSNNTSVTGNKPKRILLLLDARHGMKKADLDFLEMLQKQQQQILPSGSPTKNRKISPPSLIPPIQLVLTKCDLVTQTDLARRVVQVREQFNDVMMRETSRLPILLVSARAGVGYNNRRNEHDTARGGILELQKELASLAAVDGSTSSSSSPTTTNALPIPPSRPGTTTRTQNSIQATKRPRAGRIGTRASLPKMSSSRKAKR